MDLVPAPDGGAPQRGARMEICTPEGCKEPWEINVGGSRLGVRTDVTMTLKSIGDEPLTIANIDVLQAGSEFACDPFGDVGIVLAPGESVPVRVSHEARDGITDSEILEVISNAEDVRSRIRLVTEYKGVSPPPRGT